MMLFTCLYRKSYASLVSNNIILLIKFFCWKDSCYFFFIFLFFLMLWLGRAWNSRGFFHKYFNGGVHLQYGYPSNKGRWENFFSPSLIKLYYITAKVCQTVQNKKLCDQYKTTQQNTHKLCITFFFSVPELPLIMHTT